MDYMGQAIKKKIKQHKLTALDRSHIKTGNFALPNERKYPIEDESHARNALARVSQHGTPAEQAQVRRKVQEKYPNIKQSKE
jgi:hypothetical protein